MIIVGAPVVVLLLSMALPTARGLAPAGRPLRTSTHPSMFDAGPFAHELQIAHAAAEEAGKLLLELTAAESMGGPGRAREQQDIVDAVDRALGFELTTEAACLANGKWRWFTDISSVFVVLENDAKPVLALVWQEDEAAFAVRDLGTYVQERGDADADVNAGGTLPRPVRAGGDSAQHAIFNLPLGWSTELEELVVATFSEKWPLRVVRPPARPHGGGCCDGLLDVALGRADVAVSAPSRLNAPSDGPNGVGGGADSAARHAPAAVVLGCLQLMLEESGGTLSDVYGEEIEIADLCDEAAAAAATSPASLRASSAPLICEQLHALVLSQLCAGQR